MNKNSMFKLTICILIVVLMIGCLVIYSNQESQIEKLKAEAAVVPHQDQIPGPEVKQGSYTIFQYCQNGWTNHLYAIAYYKQGQQVYAELRQYPGEYIPVDGQTLILPEFIEDPRELMDYGFWEPAEIDW